MNSIPTVSGKHCPSHPYLSHNSRNLLKSLSPREMRYSFQALLSKVRQIFPYSTPHPASERRIKVPEAEASKYPDWQWHPLTHLLKPQQEPGQQVDMESAPDHFHLSLEQRGNSLTHAREMALGCLTSVVHRVLVGKQQSDASTEIQLQQACGNRPSSERRPVYLSETVSLVPALLLALCDPFLTLVHIFLWKQLMCSWPCFSSFSLPSPGAQAPPHMKLIPCQAAAASQAFCFEPRKDDPGAVSSSLGLC